MNPLDLTAIVAVALVIIAWLNAFVRHHPRCRCCLHPVGHPYHYSCQWKRCQGGHHPYEPETDMLDLALVVAAVVLAGRLLALALGA